MSDNKLNGFIALTKPTILLVVTITVRVVWYLKGVYFQIRCSLCWCCCCSAFQAVQRVRSINTRAGSGQEMKRTRNRRPLPTSVISPEEALIFSILLGILSVVLFWIIFNPLSALLSLGTILFYALSYTIILKPRTPMNIVIGGAAGSMGPVISWAAAAGSLSRADNFVCHCFLLDSGTLLVACDMLQARLQRCGAPDASCYCRGFKNLGTDCSLCDFDIGRFIVAESYRYRNSLSFIIVAAWWDVCNSRG